MLKGFRWMREAAAASTQAALERGDLAQFEGADDPDDDDVQEMTEDGGEQKDCPTCKGSGKIMGGNRDCPDCNGTGKVSAVKESAFARDLVDLREAFGRPIAWFSDGSLREAAMFSLAEKDYSTGKRVEFAKAGKAIPVRNDKGEVTGGAFPINDAGDLKDAIKLVGQADNPAQAKAHIVKCAKKLGATDALPDGWASASKESAGLEDRVNQLERMLRSADSIRESTPDHMNQEFGPTARAKNSRGDWGYEVTLIREGHGNQSDGAWYPGSALKELAESGRAEGMQAFADHPTMDEEEQRPERSVRELIGTHTDVRYVEEAGTPKVKAIFVPITTDKQDPHYGWVNQLAEAAARNKGPTPLVGWSLFGLSAGDEGKRPDGSDGRIVSLVIPSSGDMVTNAGAGGEFARNLMMESARRLRRAHTTTTQEDEPMLIGQFQKEMAEALKELREASTPDAQAAAHQKVEALQAEASKITAAAAPPESIEALTESAPKLVADMREAAKREAADDVEGLKTQLRESQEREQRATNVLSGIANVQKLAESVRAAGIEDEVELRHFIGQAQQRGLSEPDDIKSMIESEQAYADRQTAKIVAGVREAMGEEFPEVEGFQTRAPESGEESSTGWGSALRESNVPLKEQAAA